MADTEVSGPRINIPSTGKILPARSETRSCWCGGRQQSAGRGDVLTMRPWPGACQPPGSAVRAVWRSAKSGWVRKALLRRTLRTWRDLCLRADGHVRRLWSWSPAETDVWPASRFCLL